MIHFLAPPKYEVSVCNSHAEIFDLHQDASNLFAEVAFDTRYAFSAFQVHRFFVAAFSATSNFFSESVLGGTRRSRSSEAM